MMVLIKMNHILSISEDAYSLKIVVSVTFLNVDEDGKS